MEHIRIAADLHVNEKANTVEGLAWPYNGKPDRAGDIINKGAIRSAVTELPMLLEHKTQALIGLWTQIEDRNEGLYVKGFFNETVLAKGVRSQILTGRRNGLSIAFREKSARRNGRYKVITDLEMFECSICESPMNPDSKLTRVKTLDQAEALAAAIKRAAVALNLKG